MAIHLERLCRYPVKGLSAEDLTLADLTAGQGLAEDRRFALAHGADRYQHGQSSWMPKRHFLNLMRNERMATLRTEFEPSSGILTIRRNGKQVARGNITQQIGRDLIDQFIAAFMRDETIRAPRLVESAGVMFSDKEEKYLSIINLASVRDIERVTRQPVDPIRFRGNLMIDGARPWQEFDWVGGDITVGPATLTIVERIGRCAATNVDPVTGHRDLNIPGSLMSGFGHRHCGVYARVVSDGSIALGDTVLAA